MLKVNINHTVCVNNVAILGLKKLILHLTDWSIIVKTPEPTGQVIMTVIMHVLNWEIRQPILSFGE